MGDNRIYGLPPVRTGNAYRPLKALDRHILPGGESLPLPPKPPLICPINEAISEIQPFQLEFLKIIQNLNDNLEVDGLKMKPYLLLNYIFGLLRKIAAGKSIDKNLLLCLLNELRSLHDSWIDAAIKTIEALIKSGASDQSIQTAIEELFNEGITNTTTEFNFLDAYQEMLKTLKDLNPHDKEMVKVSLRVFGLMKNEVSLRQKIKAAGPLIKAHNVSPGYLAGLQFSLAQNLVQQGYVLKDYELYTKADHRSTACFKEAEELFVEAEKWVKGQLPKSDKQPIPPWPAQLMDIITLQRATVLMVRSEKITNYQDRMESLERALMLAESAAKSSHLKPGERSLAYQTLADILSIQEKFDEAAEAYREALKYNFTNTAAMASLADVLNWQGNYQEAIKYYQEVQKNLQPHVETSKTAPDETTDLTPYYKAKLGELEALCRLKQNYAPLLENIALLQNIMHYEDTLTKRVVFLLLEGHESSPEMQKSILPIINHLLGEKFPQLKSPTSSLTKLALDWADVDVLMFRKDEKAKIYIQAALVLVNLAEENETLYGPAQEALNKAKAFLDGKPALQLQFDLAQIILDLKKEDEDEKEEKAQEYKSRAEAIFPRLDPGKLPILRAIQARQALAEIKFLVKDYKGALDIYEGLLNNPNLTPLEQFQLMQKCGEIYASKWEGRDFSIAAQYYKTVFLQYYAKPEELEKLSPKEKLLFAKAAFGMGEMKRYGEKVDVELARTYYEKAKEALAQLPEDAVNREIKETRARIHFGLAKANEMIGDHLAAQRELLEANALKESLHDRKSRNAINRAKVAMADPLVRVTHQHVSDDKGRAEEQEIVQARVPITDHVEVGMDTQIDRGPGLSVVTPYARVRLHDINLGADTFLSLDTAGRIPGRAYYSDPAGTIRFFRQPDLLNTLSLNSRPVSLTVATSHYFNAPRTRVWDHLGLASLYANIMFNFSSVIDSPWLSGLQLGIETNWFRFNYNGESRERIIFSPVLKYTFDFGNFDKPPDWLKILKIRLSGKWGGRELVPYSEYFSTEKDGPRVSVFDKHRGSFGAGADINFGQWRIPLTLSADYEYTRQFANRLGNGHERDVEFQRWQLMLNLNIPEAYDGIKRFFRGRDY